MEEKKPQYQVYQCTKQVKAFKIKKLLGHSLVPEDSTINPVWVGNDWMMRHRPQAGGYYVMYSDEYTSYSPADAFESGYVKQD